MIGETISHYRILEKVDGGWLAVSPDEEYVLFGERPPSTSEVMLVDDFP